MYSIGMNLEKAISLNCQRKRSMLVEEMIKAINDLEQAKTTGKIICQSTYSVAIEGLKLLVCDQQQKRNS